MMRMGGAVVARKGVPPKGGAYIAITGQAPSVHPSCAQHDEKMEKIINFL
jgi:hypothetical protein